MILTVQKSTSIIEHFVNSMELTTINEREKENDSSVSLLSCPKNKENACRKKSIFSFGSNSSLAGSPKSKSRSYSMPFIHKGLPIPKGETAKIWFENMTMTISGLYCNILVVLGMSFPVAEVLSQDVPVSFYEVFYIYLYLGSMTYLIFIYATIYRQRVKHDNFNKTLQQQPVDELKIKPQPPTSTSRYGSFYLRMGAAAFGIGSMIYSGLEFAEYFELDSNANCSSVLMAVTPSLRMAFVMIQLQFIFMNDKHKNLSKYRNTSKFGLMHMIATNLCVWLNVLIQETKHEIVRFYNPLSLTTSNPSEMVAEVWPSNKTVKMISAHKDSNFTHNDSELWMSLVLNRTKRGLHRPQELFECRRANIMGSLLQNAAPFLFPCTIEYSLISAVILYALWKSVCGKEKKHKAHGTFGSKTLKPVTTNSSQYFTVDCANAHKGLFAGLVILVFTIISLIMFFALIKEEGYTTTAVFQVNLCELTLYVLSTLAAFLGMNKIKYIPYERNRHMELDTILLVMAQTGLYMYFMFSLIAGSFTREIFTRPNIFITAIFGILQSSLQTLFIIDAWWRRCTTAITARKKPARQLVTFLLISNLAMWAINHLENAQANFHPIELRFYGVWAWTIITHLSMPLAVFYRFHSTVCLCEIWKCTYKMRLQNELMKV